MSELTIARDIEYLRYDLARDIRDVQAEIRTAKREMDAAIGALAQTIDKIRSEGHCEQWYEERAAE